MILERSGKAFLGLILILCAFDDVLSQSTTTQQTRCPRVTVSCGSINKSPYIFTASVTGADANQTFSYQWTVYRAKLVSGQGTPVIKRLDRLAVQLRNTRGSLGYIVSTGKWALAEKAIRYLVSKHDLKPGRVTYLEKKRKGPLLITLYLAPPGASPPG